MSLPHWEIFQL